MGIDEPLRDSHDGPESDARERIVPGAKGYTRAQWDAFVHALEALPEKPRHEQRVTVSDAMKEIRAHITATQAKGYTLEEIVQEAGRKGLDVSIGAVKYALYRPEPSDAASRTANPKAPREADQCPVRSKLQSRRANAWTTPMTSHDNKGEGVSTSRDRWRFRTRSRLRSDLISKTCRRSVMDTIHPIYLIGGSKGGVGKSMVTLALADYLQRQGIHAVLLETDTSNPDVMKALRDEIKCAAYDLDDADGWIGFVNFCDAHRGAAVIVNTAARNQTGVTRYGGTLARTLAELERQLVVLWVINRQRDSLELLHIFGQTFPDTLTHVVRNGYFGEPDKFTLYQESQLRKAIETKGRSLDFPDLADRVADELRSQRISIRKAAEVMQIGQRAELFRWRELCDDMGCVAVRRARRASSISEGYLMKRASRTAGQRTAGFYPSISSALS
jgi:hypothetical protein